MIEITRLDGSHLLINSDLIEFIEATPDTVITLSNQKKLVVRDTPEELLDRIMAYRRQVGGALPPVVNRPPEPPPEAR
jgi:flagellar protein FlbD